MVGGTLAQYRILEELGSGGMGLVYRAQDTKLGRDVALKVLSRDRALTKADTERFLREARAAAALRHPNICTVYDVGEENGTRYISMAFIPGKSVDVLLADGPLPVAKALDIAVEIAKGLQAAHERGIVHRDIKAANVICDDDGRVTILDFGVAKLAGHSSQTGEGPPTGTVAYMSPEQASGEDVDHRSDVWSLGVCLYEMIAGSLPFKGDHNSAVIYQIVNVDAPPLVVLRADVPGSVVRIVERAMAKRREDRYRLIDEMLSDLKLARADLESGERRLEPSIAVLPFRNMSTDPAQDYFCDGMAEEIINSLVHVEGLRVAARTSSFGFRDGKDIREIGRRLGVDTIMEGSVQKSGNRLRITAQLISVRDGYHLWSQRYDRDLEDVFAIQDEIARNIVRALEVTLTEKEEEAIERVPTTDMRAYDSYIRGLHHYHELNRKSLDIGRNLYTTAIIRDPNYALAYCGLADCYSMIVSFYDHDPSHLENALAASEKAIELEPGLAEAHASRGLALSLGNRFEEADEEFARAVALSPKLYEAYYFHARSCRSQGQLERAAELFEKATEMRPEDYQAPILAGDTYRGLERPEEMMRAFREGLAIAERHLELHPSDARAWYLGAHAHFEMGRPDIALEWNERAMVLSPRDPATLYNAGCLFSLVGEVDRCFECFEKAVEYGFSNRRWLEGDPDLAAVRGDPRFHALLESIDSGQP